MLELREKKDLLRMYISAAFASAMRDMDSTCLCWTLTTVFRGDFIDMRDDLDSTCRRLAISGLEGGTTYDGQQTF